MHISTTLTGTIGAIMRLYIVVAMVRCYKYIWRAVTTVLGIILLIGLTILIGTLLFYSIHAILLFKEALYYESKKNPTCCSYDYQHTYNYRLR